MRLDLHAAEAGGAPRGPLADASPRGLDRVELAALAVFALLSLWTLGLDLWRVAVDGRVWTGTDGV
jgi:hypothetical protein